MKTLVADSCLDPSLPTFFVQLRIPHLAHFADHCLNAFFESGKRYRWDPHAVTLRSIGNVIGANMTLIEEEYD